MTGERKIGTAGLILILWLASAACATTSTTPPAAAPSANHASPSAPAAHEQPVAWTLDGSTGARGAGAAIGARLLAAFPFLANGRVAVAGDSGVPGDLQDGIVEGAGGGSMLASGLGLKGTAREIVSQLAPSTFRALVWLQPSNRQPGEIELQLWATDEARQTSTVLMEFVPPLQDEPHLLAGRQWLSFSIPVCGLAWQPGKGGGLWVRRGAGFVKIDLETRGQETVATGSGIPEGACLLRWEENTPGDGALGCFSLAPPMQGGWLARFSANKPVAVEPLREFPLPEKAKRFLSAPFQPDAGDFLLKTASGDALGTFTDLVWLQGETGTTFVALGPDGTIWAVRGDLLSLIPGPRTGPCAAIAASEGELYVAEAGPPYNVRFFSLQADHSWLQSSNPVSMPSPVLAMAAASTGKQKMLFMLCAGQPEQLFIAPLAP